MKMTSDLTNLTTAILILTVQMFIEWTLKIPYVVVMVTFFCHSGWSKRLITFILGCLPLGKPVPPLL
jgi:hypothetical protein